MDSNSNSSYLARVQWFDATSGEGMVVLDGTGESLYMHYTCIGGIDKNGYTAPTLKDQDLLKELEGCRCRVTVYENLYSRRIDTAEFDLVTVVE